MAFSESRQANTQAFRVSERLGEQENCSMPHLPRQKLPLAISLLKKSINPVMCRRNSLGFRSQKDLASPLHTHAGAQRRGNLKNGGRMVKSKYLLTAAILFGTAGVGL
jgi:hypothetical protein